MTPITIPIERLAYKAPPQSEQPDELLRRTKSTLGPHRPTSPTGAGCVRVLGNDVADIVSRNRREPR